MHCQSNTLDALRMLYRLLDSWTLRLHCCETCNHKQLILFWSNLLDNGGICQGTSSGVCRGRCSQHTSCWYRCVQLYRLQHLHTSTHGRQHQLLSVTSLVSFLLPSVLTCPTFWSSPPWLSRSVLYVLISLVYMVTLPFLPSHTSTYKENLYCICARWQLRRLVKFHFIESSVV